MQPGPSNSFRRVSSSESAQQAHNDRHYGLHQPDSATHHGSAREEHGDAAITDVAARGIGGNDTSAPPQSPVRGRLSLVASSEFSVKTIEDPTDKTTSGHDVPKAKRKTRDQVTRAIARSKGVVDDEVHILDLPNELLTHVLSYLPAETLTAAALVSHRFHQLVTTPHAWRNAFLRYFPGQDIPDAIAKPVGREVSNVAGGGRPFTRLTALASWRSEYILRTRLLRHLERGKPGNLSALSSAGNRNPRARQLFGTANFETELPSIVDHIHGEFGSPADGRRHGFRYGTSDIGQVGYSETSDNRPHYWGLVDLMEFRHYSEWGIANAWGLGSGTVVTMPNPMDVSQPFGTIHGEGVPGGRLYFHHALENHGKFLKLHSNEASLAAPDIPSINPELQSICSLWIAKSRTFQTISKGLLGILAGLSNGMLIAYSLGTDATYSLDSGGFGLISERVPRGEITAKWAICPGIPIVQIKVDGNYNASRKDQNRVFVVVLNALGEIFYLKNMFTRPKAKIVRHPTQAELYTLAWATGRSVEWHLAAPTARVATEFEGEQSPRSSWSGARLTTAELRDETLAIERAARKTPHQVQGMYVGWDMRRQLEVDFAGDDDRGAGESFVIFDCGLADDARAPARVRRFVRRLQTTADVELQEPRSGNASPAQRPVQDDISHNGPTDRAFDHWLLSNFSLADLSSPQLLQTSLDKSTFATLTVAEDPLLTVSSRTSSPWSSPGLNMSQSVTKSDIPGLHARLMAVGTNSGHIVIWDIRAPAPKSGDRPNTINPIRIIKTDSPRVTCLALTSLYLVHGGSDGLVQAWDPLGGYNGPVRTINSRYLIRARQTFVTAMTTPDSVGYEFFRAGVIELDTDPTSMRGIVSTGSLLRHWFYSSDAVDRYKRGKRRMRQHHRATLREASAAAPIPGNQAIKYFIAEQYHELKWEEREERQEQARLADRFGVGLLGPNATEEETLAYATLLSQETEEHRALGSPPSLPAHATSSDIALLSSSAEDGGYDLDADGIPTVQYSSDPEVDEGIRRSLRETDLSSSPEVYTVRYKREKRRSPKRSPPQNASVGWSSPRPGPSRTPPPGADDLQFALQLSLAEDISRKEAQADSSSVDFWAKLRERDGSDAGENGGGRVDKGKGKERDS